MSVSLMSLCILKTLFGNGSPPLGKLFSLIGLGDIEEARSQMKLAFKRALQSCLNG